MKTTMSKMRLKIYQKRLTDDTVKKRSVNLKTQPEKLLHLKQRKGKIAKKHRDK